MTLLPDNASIIIERLCLRRFTPGDLEFLVALHSSEVVTRYIGHGRPRPREETIVWLDTVLRMYDQHGLGQWAVVRQSDGQLIGRCGPWALQLERASSTALPRAWFYDSVAPADCDVTTVAEIGYTFAEAHWGQGYAREAVHAVVEHLHVTTPELEKVSLIHPDNVRSSHLIARFATRREGWVECLGQRVHLYRWL